MAPDGGTVLAVIPARSGSKRCPGKNFREFRGKTLVDWAMDAAQGSRYIDRIKLSFDRDRPPELCTDEATCEDVLRYHQAQFPHDWIVLLQPTSPLRTAEDIDRCIEAAVSNGSAALTVDERGHRNGAVYVASREWLAEHEFTHAGYRKVPMPDSRSLDINLPEDFENAEQFDFR